MGVSVRAVVSVLFLPFVVCFLGTAFDVDGWTDPGEKVVSIAEDDGSGTTHGVTREELVWRMPLLPEWVLEM